MINFYTEKLDDALFSELLPILNESRDEVYMAKENKSLALSMELDTINNNNVNYKYYLEKQRQGLLNICTIRDGNKLVGHWTLILHYHEQSKGYLVANCQNLHIIKEYRKNNNSKNFMSYTESVLKKKGVKIIHFGVNPKLNTDRLLRMQGYSTEEIILSKEL